MDDLGFEIISNILSFASINDKCNARLVNKLWNQAANYQLLSLRAIYADEPVAINNEYYMMNLLPTMEKEEHTIYQRYSGNQLYLSRESKMFPTRLHHFLDRFCPNVEGLVCNAHIYLHYMIPYAYTFKFIQCFSLCSWRQFNIFVTSNETYSAYSQVWERTWSSATVQRSRHMNRFTSLESLRANCHSDDLLRLVSLGVPVKAMYSNMLVQSTSQLPPDIKYIDWRISEQFSLPPLWELTTLKGNFNCESLIHLDISLKYGQANFTFPNLKRINITINNRRMDRGEISEGFSQSICSSKKLQYIKLQVLHLGLEHLHLASDIVYRLSDLTDLLIVGLTKNQSNWQSRDLDGLISSIITCTSLRRLHLEFAVIDSDNIIQLGRSLNQLTRLVIDNFNASLALAFLSNIQANRCKVLTLQESTNFNHKMSVELHSKIQDVLSNGILNRLTSHFKCRCLADDGCSLHSLNHREEWRSNPYKLIIH